jgi:methionyl-tRNA formyltransferase
MHLVMMGTGTFAEPTFEAIVASRHSVVGLVTQPDRPAGQERGSTRQTGRGMAAIAREHGIPVFQPESVNTPEGIAGVKEFRPDLLVVAAYGQILSNDVLSVPGQGGINVHASLLPKYRGAAPVAWAIYHGETRTGVTIIRMSVRLDAGDIMAQEAIDIGAEETSGELEARLAPLGAKLARHVIDEIAAGTAKGTKQDASQATKAPKLKKENGLIDWSRSARDVCNQIRAMRPWPTAYTYLHRAGTSPMRFIVHRAHDLNFTFPSATPLAPGTAVTWRMDPPLAEPNLKPGLWVIAGANGLIELEELQPAGKRRMAAAEFLRGHPLQPGDRFGGESS